MATNIQPEDLMRDAMQQIYRDSTNPYATIGRQRKSSRRGRNPEPIYRSYPAVYDGPWTCLPYWRTIMALAHEKDLKTNDTTMKKTLRVLVEIVICLGGMLPRHGGKYHRAVEETLQQLGNIMLVLLVDKKTIGGAGIFKQSMDYAKIVKMSEGSVAGGRRVLNAESMIKLLLGYHILGFKGNPEASWVYDFIQSHSKHLTTAIFNREGYGKESSFLCDITDTIVQGGGGPCTLEQAHAACEIIIAKAQRMFDANLSSSQNTGTVILDGFLPITRKKVKAAVRSCLADKPFPFDYDRMTCFTNLLAEPINQKSQEARTTWKITVDRQLEEAGLQSDQFWECFDPKHNIVNGTTVYLTPYTTTIEFYDSFTQLINAVASPFTLDDEFDRAIAKLNLHSVAIRRLFNAMGQTWIDRRTALRGAWAIGDRGAKLNALEQLLLVLHPPAQVTSLMTAARAVPAARRSLVATPFPRHDRGAAGGAAGNADGGAGGREVGGEGGA